jgi:polar amino acid transport system ATP-binding protein
MLQKNESAQMPCVEIRDVDKYYGQFHVLRGIDLTIKRGEVCVAIGPSGSGKSTLLRCVNQLEDISAGRIFVNGELVGYKENRGRMHVLSPAKIAEQRRGIGMVFQRFNLFPHMTAIQNVIEGPIHVKRTPRKAAVERGMALLDRVGLSARAHHYPSQLGAGRRTKVPEEGTRGPRAMPMGNLVWGWCRRWRERRREAQTWMRTDRFVAPRCGFAGPAVGWARPCRHR